MAGRFAVSVQDLNNHKDNSNAHSSTNISTAVSINSVPQTTVTGALTALNSYIAANAAPNASAGTAGKVQLTTDLGGTYNSPFVVGLLGKALIENSLSPNYTWVYSGANWVTAPTPVGGDIAYVSNVMRVNSIGGDLGVGNISVGKDLNYTGSYAMNISHTSHNSSTTPNSIDMGIVGKNIIHASNTDPGGDVYVNSGTNTTNNYKGSVRINQNSIQSVNSANANKINVLGGSTLVTSASSSLNTLGNGTNIIGSTASEPVGGSALGTILYSTGGLLKYRNNGSSVNNWVGNPENPEIWRDVANNNSGSVYKERFVTLQAINTVSDIRTYSINNTAIFSNTFPRMILVRVKFTGVANSTGADSRTLESVAVFKVLTGPTLSQVGATLAIFDVGGANVTGPAISFTGTNIRVVAGYHGSQLCRSHYQIEIMQY